MAGCPDRFSARVWTICGRRQPRWPGSTVWSMPSASTAADSTGEVDPVKVFAGLLRGLQTESGGPSVRTLESLFDEIDVPFSRSAIQDKLTGRTAPDFVFVEAFVRACAL